MLKAKSIGPKCLFQKTNVNTLKVIEINEDQKLKIENFYQYLLNSNFPFDALCWALAELELLFEQGSKRYSERDVIKRAEELFDSDLDYDTLCGLISRFKIYLEEIKLYP